MQASMTTTTFELHGYPVVRNLGVVRGITVRSRSIEEAFEMLLQHATELMQGVTEVLCYGTAVVVEPVK
jgi:uncharacterized protein YbjQ (UPF0145 family)